MGLTALAALTPEPGTFGKQENKVLESRPKDALACETCNDCGDYSDFGDCGLWMLWTAETVETAKT